jgi:hypothetical protein
MRTCLPVRVETLWWLRVRGLRRLVRLPLVLDDLFVGPGERRVLPPRSDSPVNAEPLSGISPGTKAKPPVFAWPTALKTCGYWLKRSIY